MTGGLRPTPDSGRSSMPIYLHEASSLLAQVEALIENVRTQARIAASERDRASSAELEVARCKAAIEAARAEAERSQLIGDEPLKARVLAALVVPVDDPAGDNEPDEQRRGLPQYAWHHNDGKECREAGNCQQHHQWRVVGSSSGVGQK